jgi:signal transduction histidine kinase
MSDRALKAAGYGVLGLCLVCFLMAGVFELLNPPVFTSWGSGNTAVIVAFEVATLAFPVVGVLIVNREPRNTIGWLMLAIGAVWAWSGPSEGYVAYALVTEPGSLPAPEVVAALSSWLWVPAIGLMGVYLILLFPDGHLPSPRWRPVAWVSGVALVVASAAQILLPGPIDDTSVEGIQNPLGVSSLSGLVDVAAIALFVLPVGLVLSAASLVVRFRRSRGVERLQVKWLATAGALVAVTYAVGIFATLSVPSGEPFPDWVMFLQDAGLVSFIVIPVAIGVAILKHRLYGIDVVINKSVVFGTLAAFITVVYVGIVVGVGRLVGRGESPSLVLSIAATTVVAVAFQPVRAQVQRLANRLVYGARATPYEVLSEFAGRVGGSYDTTELLPMMARTVGQGVGADEVGVWLASAAGIERGASWSPHPDRSPGRDAVADLAEIDGDLVVDVRHGGELLGAISVVKPVGEPVTPTEAKLLEDVAAQAGLVLRNVRLIEELRASTQRLVRAQDDERRRLERNLHDGAQQSLVAVALMLRMIRARMGPDAVPAGEPLDRAAEQLAAAIEELRHLARGIYPAILSERGLGPAVSSLAERSPVPVVVDVRLDDRLPGETERALYFVAAEALANAAQHASATEVQVRVARQDGQVRLEVVDDGVGGADQARGTGLRRVGDRVAAADGVLEITSPQGGGTRIASVLPVASPSPAPEAPGPQQPALPLGAPL